MIDQCDVLAIWNLLMKKEQLLAAYQWRFACKEFDARQKITREDFQFLLEILRLSPSSFGLQPYQVLVLTDKNLLAALAQIVWGGKKQLPSASEVLLFVTRKDIRHDSEFIRYMLTAVRELPEAMIDTYVPLIQQHQAVDFALLQDERYLQDWAGKQAYIALGNVMSAAASIGIDSCPIEGFAMHSVSQLLADFKVIDPEQLEPCVFCALGYRLAPPARAKTRLAMEEFVRFV